MLTHVLRLKDGRHQQGYSERCKCGASLYILLTDWLSRSDIVDEVFIAWRMAHKDCDEQKVQP